MAFTNSYYACPTDPVTAGETKNYGAQQIALDVGQMQKDMEAGALINVEFIDNASVKAALQQKIDQAHVKNTATGNAESERRLNAAKRDLEKATRDRECLIKGCVPSRYINTVKN